MAKVGDAVNVAPHWFAGVGVKGSPEQRVVFASSRAGFPWGARGFCLGGKRGAIRDDDKDILSRGRGRVWVWAQRCAECTQKFCRSEQLGGGGLTERHAKHGIEDCDIIGNRAFRWDPLQCHFRNSGGGAEEDVDKVLQRGQTKCNGGVKGEAIIRAQGGERRIRSIYRRVTARIGWGTTGVPARVNCGSTDIFFLDDLPSR